MESIPHELAGFDPIAVAALIVGIGAVSGVAFYHLNRASFLAIGRGRSGRETATLES
jgi:hypothetical protein